MKNALTVFAICVAVVVIGSSIAAMLARPVAPEVIEEEPEIVEVKPEPKPEPPVAPIEVIPEPDPMPPVEPEVKQAEPQQYYAPQPRRRLFPRLFRR
jgi:hypothetical protein